MLGNDHILGLCYNMVGSRVNWNILTHARRLLSTQFCILRGPDNLVEIVRLRKVRGFVKKHRFMPTHCIILGPFITPFGVPPDMYFEWLWQSWPKITTEKADSYCIKPFNLMLQNVVFFGNIGVSNVGFGLSRRSWGKCYLPLWCVLVQNSSK